MTKNITPEELELLNKEKLFSDLKEKLFRRELDIATMEVNLKNFEMEYADIIGRKQAQLLDIHACIWETLAANTTQKSLIGQAEKVRKKADQVTSENENLLNQEWNLQKSGSNENIKKMFYKAAKAFHPDLTTEDNEILKRKNIMIEVNKAYNNNDISKLEEIIEEWEDLAIGDPADDLNNKLVRTIRKIAQIQSRLDSLEGKFEKYVSSSIYNSWRSVVNARRFGRELLQETADKLDNRINLISDKLFETLKADGVKIAINTNSSDPIKDDEVIVFSKSFNQASHSFKFKELSRSTAPPPNPKPINKTMKKLNKNSIPPRKSPSDSHHSDWL